MTNLCFDILLLLSFLFLFLQVLLVLGDERHQVGDVLVRLGQQVGQALVLLLVDQLPVALLIFFLISNSQTINEIQMIKS